MVPPLLRQFRPQILVDQYGCDSHLDTDPLTNLELTIDAQRCAHAAIQAAFPSARPHARTLRSGLAAATLDHPG